MMCKQSYVHAFVVCFMLLLIPPPVPAQDSPSFRSRNIVVPQKLLAVVNRKVQTAKARLDRQTRQYLSKLEHEEKALHRKLHRKDSALAKELFAEVEEQYARLRQGHPDSDPHTSVYNPYLDSIATAFRFLEASNFLPSGANSEGAGMLKLLHAVQGTFNQGNTVKNFLEERQTLLAQSFGRLGIAKELGNYQKQVHYYKARMDAYRQMLAKPHALEAKLMEVLARNPAFQDFFARNAQLAQLFALPAAPNTTGASLQGLQTRALLAQLLQDRFGSGESVRLQLQQNITQVQAQLSELGEVAARAHGVFAANKSADEALPDFKPNSQRTKSFSRRLEYGTNFQSQRARGYFPATTDLAVSLGFRLNDKSVLGVGASYKLGLGTGWDHIRLSHQGIGLRSFVDYQIKGALFLSGGYEQNYRTAFHSVEQLKKYEAWQVSGLIGLSKKYMINKRLKGNMQLLWDFLAHTQMPRTQTILWRVGYTLK